MVVDIEEGEALLSTLPALPKSPEGVIQMEEEIEAGPSSVRQEPAVAEDPWEDMEEDIQQPRTPSPSPIPLHVKGKGKRKITNSPATPNQTRSPARKKTRRFIIDVSKAVTTPPRFKLAHQLHGQGGGDGGGGHDGDDSNSEEPEIDLSDGDWEDDHYKIRLVTLEEFLYGDSNDAVRDPRWMLSGINANAERMRIDLEPFCHTLDQPVVTSDIDSVFYYGYNLPITEDLYWRVHNQWETNIKDNNHLEIEINGDKYKFHQLPNMSVARFGPNGMYAIYMVFPWMRLKDNLPPFNTISEGQRRKFYDNIFYPALRQALPSTMRGHIPLWKYDAERKRQTDFKGHHRSVALHIDKSCLNDLVQNITQISQSSSDYLEFRDVIYAIHCKGMKLLAHSSLTPTEEALQQKLRGLDFAAMNLSCLFVDVGFEIHGNEAQQDTANNCLIWKASTLKVRELASTPHLKICWIQH